MSIWSVKPSAPAARSLALARLMWRAARWRSVLFLLFGIGIGLIPLAVILAVAELVDAAAALLRDDGSDGAWSRAMVATAVVAAGFIVSGIGSAVMNWLDNLMTTRYVLECDESVARVVAVPDGIDHLESPEFAADLAAIREFDRTGVHRSAMPSLRITVTARVTGLGATALLWGLAWWAPLVMVGAWALVNAVFTRWVQHGGIMFAEQGSAGLRRANYLHDLGIRPRAAKEVRVFGLADWLVDGYARTWRAAMSSVWEQRAKRARIILVGIAAIAVSHVVVLAAVGFTAASGGLAIGAIAAFVQATMATSELGPIGDPQWIVTKAGVSAQRIEAFRERMASRSPRSVTRIGGEGRKRGARDGSSAAAAVVVDDVSFRYPDQDRLVLDGVNLRIPRGQSIAIVGENGAGKSTLIKLLCGLYEPTSGSITVGDGDHGPHDGTVSAIFQDFVRYELSLRDNVAFGARGTVDDEELTRALRAAGGESLLESLPHGWDTMLSPGHDDGVDLSGGQWQRVAMARALLSVRAGAGLLILDEPTANLDIRAEIDMFDKFLSLTTGVTAVLVTHRLASVQFVDRVIVLDEGRVVEDGDHRSLMALDGRYRRMFTIQAERFAESTGPSHA